MAQRALIDAYVCVEHRDSAADGCPAAALVTDMARTGADPDRPGREAHRVFAQGVADLADWLATDDQDGTARLCTMLGALVLARATKDSPLSEEILAAAHAALTEAH